MISLKLVQLLKWLMMKQRVVGSAASIILTIVPYQWSMLIVKKSVVKIAVGIPWKILLWWIISGNMYMYQTVVWGHKNVLKRYLSGINYQQIIWWAKNKSCLHCMEVCGSRYYQCIWGNVRLKWLISTITILELVEYLLYYKLIFGSQVCGKWLGELWESLYFAKSNG